MTGRVIEVDSIDDLTININGTIILDPNTVYIFNNAIEFSCVTTCNLKRKLKRFNRKRYQTVTRTQNDN